MTARGWSSGTSPSFRILRFGVAALIALSLVQSAATAEGDDYFQEGRALFGEEMVESASKFRQDANEVPATVTVLTREEIRRYGFRTLSDVLNFASAGGFTSNDRFYNFLGMRGMFAFDDYNTRLVLLLDGHVLNEPYNNFAGMGREMLVPLDLVERIEIVYGPWGVLYGSSNIYGTVNVVTRDPASIQGLAFRLTGGTQTTGEALFSYGVKGTLFDREAKALFSGGEYKSDGPRSAFPEVDVQPDAPWYGPFRWDGSTVWGGRANPGAERESAPFLFFDGTVGDLRLLGRWGYRDKHHPMGPYGSAFGDGRNHVKDTRSFAELSWSREVAPGRTLTASLSEDAYQYLEGEAYVDPSVYADRPGYLWTLRADTRRRAGEVRYNARLAHGQWLVGANFRSERIDQTISNEDLEGTLPPADRVAQSIAQKVWSAYTLGQWDATDRVHLSAGLNYVKYNYLDSVWLYRVACVFRPMPELVLKAIAGRGFRASSFYEYGYQDTNANLRNPTLKPEESPAYELSATWLPTARFQGTLSAFHQKNEGFITPLAIRDPSQIQGDVLPPGADPQDYIDFLQYQNLGTYTVAGGSLSAKGLFGAGYQAYGNLTWARATYRWEGSSGRPDGAPQITANAGVSGARGPVAWGVAACYFGPVNTAAGHASPVHITGGRWDTRGRLAWERIAGKDLRLELLVTNLLDRSDPVAVSSIYIPDAVRPVGRAASLSLVYRF